MRLLLENWREFLEEDTPQQLLNEQMPKHAGPRITYPILGPCSNQHKKDSEKWNRCVDAERKAAKAEQGPKKLKVTPITSPPSRPEKCTPEEIANKTCYEVGGEHFIPKVKVKVPATTLEYAARVIAPAERCTDPPCEYLAYYDITLPPTTLEIPEDIFLQWSNRYTAIRNVKHRIRENAQDVYKAIWLRRNAGLPVPRSPKGSEQLSGRILAPVEMAAIFKQNPGLEMAIEYERNPESLIADVIMPSGGGAGTVGAGFRLPKLAKPKWLKRATTALQSKFTSSAKKYEILMDPLKKATKEAVDEMLDTVARLNILRKKGFTHADDSVRHVTKESVQAYAKALNAYEAQETAILKEIQRLNPGGNIQRPPRGSVLAKASKDLTIVRKRIKEVERSLHTARKWGMDPSELAEEALGEYTYYHKTLGAHHQTTRQALRNFKRADGLVEQEKLGYKIIGGMDSMDSLVGRPYIIIEYSDGTRHAYFKSSGTSYDQDVLEFAGEAINIDDQLWLPFGGFGDSSIKGEAVNLTKYTGKNNATYRYLDGGTSDTRHFPSADPDGWVRAKYLNPDSEMARISKNINHLGGGRKGAKPSFGHAGPNMFSGEMDILHTYMRNTKGHNFVEILDGINDGLRRQAVNQGKEAYEAFRVNREYLALAAANTHLKRLGALNTGKDFPMGGGRGIKHFPGQPGHDGGIHVLEHPRIPPTFTQMADAFNRVGVYRENKNKNKTKLIIEVRKRKQTQLFNI